MGPFQGGKKLTALGLTTDQPADSKFPSFTRPLSGHITLIRRFATESQKSIKPQRAEPRGPSLHADNHDPAFGSPVTLPVVSDVVVTVVLPRLRSRNLQPRQISAPALFLAASDLVDDPGL